MAHASTLEAAIKQEAYRSGFSLAGITTCDSLPHAGVFAAWLEAGRQGEMSYLASPRSRQCRAHPTQILPECRSVVVLATRYPSPPPSNPAGAALLGKIAAYAWGVDYHAALPGRLQALAQFVQAQVGHSVPSRWYTDTGPILERELAQRAGLGWIGKNTCLINPHCGSYFLLAEILLGLELVPDTPFTADRCGTCTRCLQACPTHCILPDRTIDARRCISYLTIELKGAIPLELRPSMDGWVFGCDVCQQVCPWNRFAPNAVDRDFAHRLVAPTPDLLQDLSLTTHEFNQRFNHTPLSRAKRRGYLRNVAVTLGNSQHPLAIPALAAALQGDPEPLVRLHAAWALGQLGGDIARAALQAAAVREQDVQVLAEIKNALSV